MGLLHLLKRQAVRVEREDANAVGASLRTDVENSLRLGEMERTGASNEEHGQLMRTTMGALMAPI